VVAVRSDTPGIVLKCTIRNSRYQPRLTRCLGRLPKLQHCALRNGAFTVISILVLSCHPTHLPHWVASRHWSQPARAYSTHVKPTVHGRVFCSLSAMNVSNYMQDVSFSSIPLVLWDCYLEYLWYYDSSSWVAKISSTIRVLAFLLVLPVAILGMLVCLTRFLLLSCAF
jgi:hypothetical protein